MLHYIWTLWLGRGQTGWEREIQKRRGLREFPGKGCGKSHVSDILGVPMKKLQILGLFGDWIKLWYFQFVAFMFSAWHEKYIQTLIVGYIWIMIWNLRKHYYYLLKSFRAYNLPVHVSRTISNEISSFLFPVSDSTTSLATTWSQKTGVTWHVCFRIRIRMTCEYISMQKYKIFPVFQSSRLFIQYQFFCKNKFF